MQDQDCRRWLEQRLEVFRLESPEGETTHIAVGDNIMSVPAEELKAKLAENATDQAKK